MNFKNLKAYIVSSEKTIGRQNHLRRGFNQLKGGSNMVTKRFVVDFFSGCGGLTCGFVATGLFLPLLAFDLDDQKLAILKRNFQHMHVVKWKLEGPIYKKILDMIVVLAMDHTPSITMEDRENWREHKIFPPISPLHIHGSPVCHDASPAKQATQEQQSCGLSQKTIQWFRDFIVFLRQQNIPHTLSMEEGERTKAAFGQLIFEALNVQELRDDTEWNKDTTYWKVINYEKCGLPASGKRFYLAKGWDIRKLTQKVGQHEFVQIPLKIEVDTDAFLSNWKEKHQWEKSGKISMYEAFTIANQQNYPGAKAWLEAVDTGKITHQQGNSEAWNNWFKDRNGDYWWWAGIRRYSGKLNALGRPLAWPSRFYNKPHNVKIAYQYARGISSRNPPRVPKPKYLYRDVHSTPSYRFTTTNVCYWVQHVPPTQITGRLVTYVGSNKPNWKNYVKHLDVNMKFYKVPTLNESRIIMTFPFDWKFCNIGDATDIYSPCEHFEKRPCADMSKIKCMEESETIFRSKPTPDEICFGDSIPPLIGMRMAMAILDSDSQFQTHLQLLKLMQQKSFDANTHTLLFQGGEDAMVMFDNTAYGRIVRMHTIKQQINMMLSVLYGYRQSDRDMVLQPKKWLMYFQRYLRIQKKRNGKLFSPKTINAYMRIVKNTNGPLTMDGIDLYKKEWNKSGNQSQTVQVYKRLLKYIREENEEHVVTLAAGLFNIKESQQNVEEAATKMLEIYGNPTGNHGETFLDMVQMILYRLNLCQYKFGFIENMNQEERRRHYRTNAIKWHPDKGGTKKDFQQFKRCYK